MRRWNGPIGSRSRRPPALTDVDMYSLPFICLFELIGLPVFCWNALRPGCFSRHAQFNRRWVAVSRYQSNGWSWVATITLLVLK